MNVKELAFFLVLFYAALWIGTMILGFIGNISDPLIGPLIAVAIPGTVLYFLWKKLKSKV